MAKGAGASDWAIRHFGDQAEEVSRRVVTAMVKAQEASYRVQAFARGEGATNRRPYGSMWEARYTFLEAELEGLDGYETFRPRGASFRLVRLDGRLLLPIRHSDTLVKPISQARIPEGIPRKVVRQHGVRPPATLFDVCDDDSILDEAESTEDASSTEIGPVVCIAVVVNAEVDQPLKVWWGETMSMNTDGVLDWAPRTLSLELAQTLAAERYGPTLAGQQHDVMGFSDGAEPTLEVNPRQEYNSDPQAEAEPSADKANSEDE